MDKTNAGNDDKSVTPDAGLEGTGCQLDFLLKFLAQEWMPHIIWALARDEAIRFGALRRAMPGKITARVLSARLKALEAEGFVSRHDHSTATLQVEYRLTGKGQALDAALRRNERLFEKFGSVTA